MSPRYLPSLIAALLIDGIFGCAGSNSETGIRYLEERNYTAAISAFDRAAAIKPHARIYYGYFQAYMAIEDYENARTHLLSGLSKYPNDAWLNLCAGHWYLNNGHEPRKALYYYQKACQLRFCKPKNVMNDKIDKYIDMAKDQIAVDSLSNDLNK